MNALERVKGIEPSSGAWKASALPLSYTRPGSKKGIIPLRNFSLLREIHLKIFAGGGGWIRTIVGVSQQIYSLPPLATRAPLRRERMKLLLKDSKLSRVTDKNPAKRYQVAYHDGSTLINTLFNASF